MDKQSIKKLLCKRPIIRLLVISLFLGALIFYTVDEKDYIITLFCPIRLTDDTTAGAFLQDERYIIGDIQLLYRLRYNYRI